MTGPPGGSQPRAVSEPLTAIRNVGPVMAASLERAGISDAVALRALGADAAYARTLEAGTGRI